MMELAPGVESVPSFGGRLLIVRAEAPTARLVAPLFAATPDEAVATPREAPFWMTIWAGRDLTALPVETQFLLLRSGETYAVVVPLLDGPFRASLQGGAGGVEAVVESGDPAVTGDDFAAVFTMEGPDPYALRAEAATAVAAILGTGRLRTEKDLPEFVDGFGWCTWDSFYNDVDHAKTIAGLETFHEGGIVPRTLILDAGWQSTDAGERLTDFAADPAKFPDGLAATVDAAKERGVESFLVWHAIGGYWAGSAMPEYDTHEIVRELSPGVVALDSFFGRKFPDNGVVDPREAFAFFSDYHRSLRAAGVDGVKVDNQATLESLAAGLGGRVELMGAYREALEGSVAVHFQNRMINCMSCSNDMLYQANTTSLTRTSDDYFPNRPESHGRHLAVNALVGFWFGEFVHPDWDMFQSAHPFGAFHAAGRAVSGGPVYVSDKPDAHDFELLKKIVLPDGGVLRGSTPGVPTFDCLMRDPTREAVPLKVFTVNGASAVVGAFHCGGAEGPLSVEVRASDVPGLREGRFAVRLFRRDEIVLLDAGEPAAFDLDPFEWEIAAIVPLDEDGFAPFGLAGQMNGGAAVLDYAPTGEGVAMTVLGGGQFLAWSERRPRMIYVGDRTIRGDYHKKRLTFDVPVGEHAVEVVF